MGEFCKTVELQLNQSLPPVLDFINVNASSFLGVCRENEILKLDSATEAKYSEPMALIGAYIATALGICTSVMVADIFINGISMNKFWVPVKIFSLNAATLTVIAVAMKLPMDLTSPMPDEIDQLAKVGSLAFLCIMMCTIMPSLAVMDNKSLVTNVTALSILVVTIVVNVGFQIQTHVITRGSYDHPFSIPLFMASYIYMCMLLFLLIIYISSALTIPTLKKVLELKYQATLKDQNIQQNHLISNVEELRQLLKIHWIMAESSSPQFVMATTPLSSASSIISAISMLMHISLSWQMLTIKDLKKASVYKGSTCAIYGAQFIGVVGGSFGSMYRCFQVLRFKSFANQSRNHFSVFKVDKYWTQQLYEWKENPLTLFSFVDIDYRLKNTILSSFIGFQRAIVILCKIIELIPIVVIIFVTHCSYYSKSLKALLCTPPTVSSSEDTEEDLSNYALLLEDDVQLTKYSVKRLLVSKNEFNKYVRSLPHNNLLNLLEVSVTFEGVNTFDIDQIQSLLPVENVNTWSLPIISLTCIAIVIPNIHKDVVDNLLKSVGQGLFYTRIVEEHLNKASEYVNIRRATVTLWHEVRDKHKWLDTTLKTRAYEGKTPTEIIKLFAYSSEKILNEFSRGTNGEPMEKENLPRKVIAANSMYRIAQTIMLTYESENLEIVEEELFSRLSAMIADILAACLTNIPRVIITKCYQSAIEKRENSVMSAVRFFAWTTKIIKRLETRELPDMVPEKRGFIDEWRLHFKQP